MAVDPSADETYSLFQKGIITRLADRSWYIDCIAHNYYELAKRSGCSIAISERRLGEAHDFWIEDQTRTLHEGMASGTTNLDHFKQAAFIAFWLRRMRPINETTSNKPLAEIADARNSRIAHFVIYGNEILAIQVGLQICLFYETARAVAAGAVTLPGRTNYLKSLQFPKDLRDDCAMVLKHKNMSPHSLYLLYRALFTSLVPHS